MGFISTYCYQCLTFCFMFYGVKCFFLVIVSYTKAYTEFITFLYLVSCLCADDQLSMNLS